VCNICYTTSELECLADVACLTLHQSWNAWLMLLASWMRSNRLQLNTAKSEVVWCSSTRRQHQIPQSPLVVSCDAVVPVRVVRDLGIYLDSSLMMQTHIADCFELFCGVETASQHPAVSVRSSLAVTCHGIDAHEARLWQRHTGKTACRSA